MADYIAKEVIRGKIAATKRLVNRQIKALKETEKDLIGFGEDELREADSEKLKEIAKLLVGYQMAVENAFNFIVQNFDEGIKGAESGANLHAAVIKQVSKEGKIRPSVIDSFVSGKLLEYLDFRLEFAENESVDRETLLALFENFESVSESLKEQLNHFFSSLEEYNDLEQ